MRIRSLRWLAVALLAAAPSAQAAVLPFTGTLSVVVSVLPPIAFTGGGLVTLNGSGGLGHLSSFALSGGQFNGLASIPQTDPAVAPIAGVLGAASNGAGAFGLGGVMPLVGSVALCLFDACNGMPAANIVVPFTQNGTRGIGIGGGPIVAGGFVGVTVQGAPWTTGTVTANVPFFPTATGFVHGPASGGASSAAQVSGAVRLVTPVVVQTNIGSLPVFPVFGVLDLHFVPEPGTLLLVAGGFAGLAVAGRRRLSRERSA